MIRVWVLLVGPTVKPTAQPRPDGPIEIAESRPGMAGVLTAFQADPSQRSVSRQKTVCWQSVAMHQRPPRAVPVRQYRRRRAGWLCVTDRRRVAGRYRQHARQSPLRPPYGSLNGRILNLPFFCRWNRVEMELKPQYQNDAS